MNRTQSPEINSSELDIVVHGRHAALSEKFKDHAIDKLSRLDRFSVPIQRVDVEVSHEANPRMHERAYEVELMCSGAGPSIRAEAHAVDKWIALDLAYAKLEERLRRLHEKSKSVRHAKPVADVGLDALAIELAEQSNEIAGDVVLESGPLVVRTKHINSQAMSIEQAIEAMELVGHDFFLFQNAENGMSSVLYRRRGYDFGLVQLQQAV